MAQRLGADRFGTIVGRKIHGRSSITVYPAPAPPAPSRFVQVSPQGSYEREDWKRQIEQQLRESGVQELPPGPVRLAIRYRLGPGRNWAALWKPTIDSLTPLLGTDHPGTFNLRDGRITRLELHQRVDPTLRHEVIVDLWWN